ncbi:MAG: hypothetical protein ACTSPI_00530 [Candidatus Heimdallarchaeaceae archaeon]
MGKEVEKKKNSEVAIFEQMAEAPTTGFEGADFESYATPFLRILQQNSPQVLEDTDSYIPDSKPGYFFNTVTNQLYGKTVNVIPVRFERLFLEWKPNREGFVGIHSVEEGIAISDPGEVFGSRIHKETGNLIQDTHTFYILIAGKEEEGPLVFPLASTGIRHSRKWLSQAKMLRLPNRASAPLYSSIYKIGTVINENDQGRWYQIGDKSKTAIERVDWINSEQFNYVKEVISMFDKIRANITKSSGFEEETPY